MESFLIKLYAWAWNFTIKRTLSQVFYFEFYENSLNGYSIAHMWIAISENGYFYFTNLWTGVPIRSNSCNSFETVTRNNYHAKAHSEPFQTSMIEFFVNLVDGLVLIFLEF